MNSTSIGPPLSKNAAKDDVSAVTLAQESIDAWNAAPRNVSESAPTAKELEELATILELLGDFSGLSTPSDHHDENSSERLTLGRYEVLGERGRGGFGIVLRAFDPLLQREVALKLPRPDKLIAGHAADDFIREAQTAACLNHPGIVPIHEVRQLGPIWYIASAYCEGPTLASWLEEQRAPLSSRVVAQLVTEIADAVQYAHSRGVLHLDLKPANILLELPGETHEYPRPLVTDFGLASRSDDGSFTGLHGVAGTQAYMAPEQRLGDASRIGVATDVYALGAVLYDMLKCGRGETSLAIETTNDPATPKRNITLCGAPRDLLAICKCCLADEPADRYESVRDLADDLQRYLQGECVHANPMAWPRRAARWCRRRPAIAALLFVLAVTTLASVTTIAGLWRSAEKALVELRTEQALRDQNYERMRTTLLNLTWMAQQAHLQAVEVGRDEQATVDELRSFYQHLADWSKGVPDRTSIDLPLLAAGHNLALVDLDSALSPEEREQEFSAGVEAWRAIIAAEPNRPEWQRALAFHLFTYTISCKDRDRLWWRDAKNSWSFDPALIDTVKAPYGMILADYARSHLQLQNIEQAYQAFPPAIALLEEVRTEPDEGGERAAALLAAYNDFVKVAELWARPAEAKKALEASAKLVAEMRIKGQSDPETDYALAQMHSRRATSWSKQSEFDKAIEEWTQAARSMDRCVASSPNNPSLRFRLVHNYLNIARIQSRLSSHDEATVTYLTAIKYLDDGLLKPPYERRLLLQRARVKGALALSHMAEGDEGAARAALESARNDFGGCEYRKLDKRTIWLKAIESCQLLAALHAKNGEAVQATEVHKQALDFAAYLEPRMKGNSHFLSLVAISRNALANSSP